MAKLVSGAILGEVLVQSGDEDLNRMRFYAQLR